MLLLRSLRARLLIMNLVSITAGGLFTAKIGALRDAGVAPVFIFVFCAIAAAASVALV